MITTLNRLLSGPVLMQPARLQSFIEVSQAMKQPTSAQVDQILGNGNSDLGEPGGIAIIKVCGVIIPEAGRWDEYFGYCGLNRRRAEMDQALGDSRISSIVMLIDSPGGSVYGVPEFADFMRQARKAKPISGFVTAEAFSAGYWIASACNDMSVTPSGGVGSIGVWTAHMDISKLLEERGIKVTLIYSGKYKVEGNQYEPLPDEAAEYIQSQVDEHYTRFVGAVAKNRDVSIKKVLNDFGQGRTLSAKAALDVGMVDRIETLDGFMKRVVKSNRNAGKSAAGLLKARTTIL